MNSQTFVHEGFLFTVEEEEDNKFVVDISLNKGLPPAQADSARVVGRFNSIGNAITAAKSEIEQMQAR